VRFLVHYAMFVRWQRSRSQALNPWLRECNDRRARLQAILVESTRVAGKPRQRHITFLGSIELDDPGMITGDSDQAHFWRRMSARGKTRFWRDVTRRLDQLDNRISPEDRDRISASIAKRVAGPPTVAELEQFERECEQLVQSLQTSLAPYGRAPRPPRRRRPLRDRVEERGASTPNSCSSLIRKRWTRPFALSPRRQVGEYARRMVRIAISQAAFEAIAKSLPFGSVRAPDRKERRDSHGSQSGSS
jgi:hypothetical protein